MLEPWRLAAPVSREVVLPARLGSSRPGLLVVGGLDQAGNSVTGAYCLDPASGHLTQVGALAQPTHDAGGAVLGGGDVVVGGGAATVYEAVQRLPGAGCGQRPPATVTGRLPQPRADVTVAQDGATAYVVGGYDGQEPDPAVLATGDGRSFRVVARLPQPVRYAAAAVAGGRLWVLGGQPGVQGSGAAAATIQRVDLATGRAAVVGRLPGPVAGAAALVLGGRILVVGGEAGGRPTSDIVAVDPGSGSARLVGHLPVPVSNAGATVAGGAGWLVGGEGPQPLATVIRIGVGDR